MTIKIWLKCILALSVGLSVRVAFGHDVIVHEMIIRANKPPYNNVVVNHLMTFAVAVALSSAMTVILALHRRKHLRSICSIGLPKAVCGSIHTADRVIGTWKNSCGKQEFHIKTHTIQHDKNFRNTAPSRRMPSRMSVSLVLPKLMRIS
jgi:hypothetical protein